MMNLEECSVIINFLVTETQRRTGMVVRGEGATMFTDEELKDISGLKKGPNYIEVTCGCTRRRFGDAVGKLRVFANGHLEINCECNPGCQEEKMSPEDFGKHAGKQDARKWKSQIWVIFEGRKVRLWRTVLLKYYKEPSTEADGSSSSSRGKQKSHRDEFVRCSRCNKERRFRLRTKEECRIYHDSLAKRRWKCADLPYYKITCDDEEERASRKSCRGCPRTPTCVGCTSCVCFGCHNCRFSDCNCRTCVDFIRNVEL